MRYLYPCTLDGDADEGYTATFPDVPEAITGALDREEALAQAGEALGTALAGYAIERRAIPVPSQACPGQIAVAVPPVVAAKLALISAMREQGVSNAALAAKLGIDEGTVGALLDPDGASQIEDIEKALRVLGRRIVVADDAA